jgi:N-acyl-D-aspartate/D-glutamate deacylase
MKDAGGGFIEMTSDWNTPDPATEFAMVRRIMDASGRPLVFSLNQRHDRTTAWMDLLDLSTKAAADGLPIRCVAPPRPIGALLGLTGSQNPFAGTRTYRSIADKPLSERVAAMRDPQVRARIVTEDPTEFNTWSLLGRIGYERMFRFGHPLNYTPSREDSIAAIASRTGATPQEVAYDMLIDDEGEGFIFACLVNYANYDLEAVKEMYSRQHVIPGLSDGGAHVAFISDASFPTFLFSYWGRDREDGRMKLHDLVRRQTREPAQFAGLLDRGVLAPGMKADINVIDFANLALERPNMVVDLPAGGRRLMQKARGYAVTMKAGQITYRNGEATGALPGGLVRGQCAVA